MGVPQPKRTYRVPKSTGDLLVAHLKECQNLQLLLHRFVPEEVIDNQEEKLTEGKRVSARYHWLQEEVLAATRIKAELWEARYQRWLALTQAASAVTFQGKLTWRMVVGLGGQSVLETDLTLDHLSGLPTIPGSALKGLTRTYAALEESDPPRKKLEDDMPEVKQIFGMQEKEHQHAGTVIFFDAMPVPPGDSGPRLRFAVDIMNPHYPDYYRENGKHAPSNDQSPVPVTFLTVEGAMFAFAVAPRSAEMRDDAAKALEWLKAALQKYGVGGKTSAGYGVFKVENSTASTEQGPRMTEDDVWAWLGRKRSVTGTVEAQSQAGAILKLDDPTTQPGQQIPKGLLAGQSRPVGTKLTCRVMGVQMEQGEWFVKLSP